MQVEPHDRKFSDDLAGDFAAAMARMAVRPTASGPAHIAVAVSGGADSMALVRLLAPWSRAQGVALHALTVDHALRDEAADEARRVAAWLAPLGVPHTTLRWEEGAAHRLRPASAQGPAREARYSLMTAWCAANGCSHLFLAHHADDQAETFLLRLARGSGVDGLAAMAPLVDRAGVRLARPLLAVPKARLTAFCDEIGQPWIEDPSNHDEGYGRVRLRAARDSLEREGLSAERLLATADHMRRARAALDHYVSKLLDENCIWDRFGIGRLDLNEFLGAPEDIGLRALARVLMTASGQVYRPRFERLLRLYASLTSGPWRDATLHGCKVVRDGATLTIAREAAQIADERSLLPGVEVVWDGRFAVEARGLPAPKIELRRLLHADVSAELRATPSWAEMPAHARETLPALFDSRGLLAVPSLDYVRADLRLLPGVNISAAFICPRIDQLAEDDAEL